jgi:molybdopterin converting factor small subunit
MPVTFHIPGALREFTAGHSTVELEGSPATLADALSALWTLYPGVRDRIATEQGQVREHINIFIGDENVRYTGGLASPISSGSEISIVPAVSGGREPYAHTFGTFKHSSSAAALGNTPSNSPAMSQFAEHL